MNNEILNQGQEVHAMEKNGAEDLKTTPQIKKRKIEANFREAGDENLSTSSRHDLSPGLKP